MNCAFDKEKLSGYYDGELDAAEKAEVERHIASCSECLRELGELKSAAILVKELPRLRAPRSIAEEVRKEIRAAGKVHSFTQARRTMMWVASAAAVLLIGVNLIYFSSKRTPAAEELATRPTSAAPALGRALPAEDPAAPVEARRKAVEQAQKTREDEARKNESFDRDRKQDAAPVVRAEPERAKTPAPKLEEKKPSAVPEPLVPAPPPAVEAPVPPAKPASAPTRAPAPAAPATVAPSPEPAPKPAEPAAPVDKASAKKEADGQSGLKQKAAEAPAADAGPTHLTLATTQLAKSRQEIADVLKKMGITMPPAPSAAMVKGVARSGAREETVNQFDLTDAQIARLRAEMDKPGSSMLMTAKPEDPVMAQFKRGGVFEEKKSSVASGGAPAKEFGDAPSAKDAPAGGKLAAAEGAAAEKSGEPRRRVVLHFLEVPYIPDRQPAADAIKR
jgi:hypothetical protein